MRIVLLIGLLATLLVPAAPCAAQGQPTTLEVAQAGPRPRPDGSGRRRAGKGRAGQQLDGRGRGRVLRGDVHPLCRRARQGARRWRQPPHPADRELRRQPQRPRPPVSQGGRYCHRLHRLAGALQEIGQYRNIDQRINYISELLDGEFYVYGRPEISKMEDLDGKKVSLGLKGSSATTTAPIVFERLGINPEFLYLSGPIAAEKMKTGEIAAIASTGGKPNDLFVKMKPEPGFHFVPVEYSNKFSDYYLPCPWFTRITLTSFRPAKKSTRCACLPFSRSTISRKKATGSGAWSGSSIITSTGSTSSNRLRSIRSGKR